MKKLNVFIESRDGSFSESLAGAVARCGARVIGNGGGGNVLFSSDDCNIDLLLLDIRESENADTFIKRIRDEFPHIEVLLINRPDNVRASMLAMKAGASDELMVPVDLNDLEEKIKKAARHVRAKKNRKSICDRFNDVMVAVTFAQAGEFETAIDVMNVQVSEKSKSSRERDGQDI